MSSRRACGFLPQLQLLALGLLVSRLTLTRRTPRRSADQVERWGERLEARMPRPWL